jgi:hypothetical protein
MEDPLHGIFRNTDEILYKQIFSNLESDELNILLQDLATSSASTLATGQRDQCDINLELYPFISDRIITTLSNYFVNLQMNKFCRFYSHKYGEVRAHTDGSPDNQCYYTLLIYLTDDFEGGELSIKIKRTDEDRKLSFPDKYHYIYTFKPMKGYGVVFNKNLLHWADIVIGPKNFLLVHLSGQL